MKVKEIIGGMIAILGLTAAVSIQDGSRYELIIRFGGIVLVIIGGLMARAFDFQRGRCHS